jgi:hypothetical protein
MGRDPRFMADEHIETWWTPDAMHPGHGVVVDPARVGEGVVRLTTTFVLRWFVAVVGVSLLVAAVIIGATGGGWAMVAVVGMLGATWAGGAAILLPSTVWTLRWDDSGLSGRMCWPRPFFLGWDEIQRGRVTAPVGLTSSSTIVLETRGRRLLGTIRRRLLITDGMHRELPSELWALVRAVEARRIPLDGRGLARRSPPGGAR